MQYGGPTIEMYCESHKVVNPENYLKYELHGEGYSIIEPENFSVDYLQLPEGVFIKWANRCGAMWIASPNYYFYGPTIMIADVEERNYKWSCKLE